MLASDWAVLLCYVALVLGIGWYVSRGTQSAEGHLRANRDLPAWAVVFSILAAEVSAATYIGVPEAGFKGDWTYLQFALGALLGKWVVSTSFVRLYWRLNLPTVYGLLAQRIGARAQRVSAWSFLCGRLVASGVRLYIAAIAFSVVTGLEVWTCILVMGGISTLYTLLGGLRAVVWTDVAQGTVFFVGALTALLVGLHQIGLPLRQVAAEAYWNGKLQLFALDGNVLASTRSLWSALLGGFLLSLAVQGTDQESVQHMLNTRSERSAGRTVLTSGLMTFPIVGAFLAVGTMLWSFQRHVGAHGYALSTPEEVNKVFPNFILHELPAGVRGLVFAGLFAAAISSLGATLNAAAAAWTHDIAPRARGISLASVRWLTAIFGLLLAGIGLFFDWFARGSTTDLVQIALGAMTILYGGILGAFLVALFTERRGNDRSVPLGMLGGIAVGALLFFQRQLFGEVRLEWPWSLALSTSVAFGLGLLGARGALEPLRLAQLLRRRPRLLREALLVALFVLGVGAPLAQRWFRRDPRGSPEAEGRQAATRPYWQWKSAAIESFPQAYEAHFDDTLAWRYPLLRWNSLSRLGLFGAYPSPSMYVGQQGFWFYAEEDARDLWRGLRPFPPDELESWCRTLAAQAQWCRARGIAYVFVLGPSKEQLYPEFVPPEWTRVGPSRYDELVAHLGGNGAPLLDLRSALESEKLYDREEARDFTYHPLGTHWTERGCWAAYAAIERALAQDCPALAPLGRAGLETRRVELPGDSWAARAYVGDVYTQPYWEVRPQGGFRQTVAREARHGGDVVLRRGPDPARPRALIFRDSFGFKVDEFLAEDCSLLVQSHQLAFDPVLVEDVHPQIVVQLYVDRRLGLAPPAFADFDESAALRERFAAASEPLWSRSFAPEQAALQPGAELELPAATLPAERFAVLRLQVDAAQAGELELRVADAPCPELPTRRAVARGRNELYVRFLGRELAHAPRLRNSGSIPLAVRDLELRAERP